MIFRSQVAGWASAGIVKDNKGLPLLQKPLYDPDSGEKVSVITMKQLSGKILLKNL
jgi:hypothetical protein